MLVFGLSPDGVQSHKKFAEKHGLRFPLLSDESKSLLAALEVWTEKSLYGKRYMGVERSTFLVGADGTVEREWRKVKAGGHASEVLESL